MLTFAKLSQAYKQLSSASTHYQVSLPWMIRRAVRLHNREMFDLKDMVAFGVLDPEIDTDKLELYVSREARTRLQVRLNDRSARALGRSKASFYKYCEEVKLPFPTTLGFFVIPDAGDESSHRASWLELLTQHGNTDLIVKPVVGQAGEGFFVAHASSQGSYCVGGQVLAPDEFYNYLLIKSPTDGLVVQLRERAHPEVQKLSGTDALQTARIVTFLNEGGTCEIMFSRFKFIVGSNYVDHLLDGRLGNLQADVNADDGVVHAVFSKDPMQIGMSRVIYHPVTGERLVGATIPLWDEIRCMTCKAARLFPKLRTLGWDIGVTPDGPVILEANPAWIVSPPGPMKRPVSQQEWRALLQPLPRKRVKWVSRS